MDEPTTAEPVPAAAGRYRIADLLLRPAGRDAVLAESRDAQATRLLAARTADLLLHCDAFRTVEEHVRAYVRGRQASPTMLRAMQAELESLVPDGFLVAERDLVEALDRRTERTGPAPIGCLGIPTRDRVELLRRNLAGFVEACRRAGRDIEFAVADDSDDPASRAACRQMLRTLAAEHRVPVTYAGLEEKLRYADLIAEAGQVPADVVRFGCVGDRRCGLSTVGANRNVLLLQATGDLMLSVDDDVACRLAAAPDRTDGVAFSSAGSPLEAWFFADRETALRSTERVERDPLGLHEHWLGRDPGAALATRAGPGLRLDEADPALLRRLRAGAGTVRVTLNGVVGDCGWDNPHFRLFQGDQTYRRLTQDEAGYRSARSSRELAQAVTRVTITDRPGALLAGCVGLDARELLPPFTPVGRAEDVAFGTLLSVCLTGTYAAHLPWVLLHDPPGSRSFPAEPAFGVGFNDWISSCLSRVDPGLGRGPGQRLSRLGAHLEDLGRLPTRPFEEFVRLQLWDSVGALIAGLEERAQSRPPPPPYWLAEAREFIDLARRTAVRPVDELYALAGGNKAIQRLLVRFGELLGLWPAIVDTARNLRAAGIRPAEPA